jgi:hypothetical protein
MLIFAESTVSAVNGLDMLKRKQLLEALDRCEQLEREGAMEQLPAPPGEDGPLTSFLRAIAEMFTFRRV